MIRLDPGSTGGGGGTTSSTCAADPAWLPDTPPPAAYEPPPHPAPNCPFYRLGYQNFLQATQPGTDGEPAFASYATIDDAFAPRIPFPAGALAPAGEHRGTSARAWLGNVKQPGKRFILVDPDRHAVYVGIHLNQAFVDFIAAHNLRTAQAITEADPNLRLPPGLVALKSAWKDVDATDGVAGDYSGFITTTAWVPRIRKDADGAINEDRNDPRLIRVALLSLQVAFTLPGHPEMIWTTFEHADTAGQPDLVPRDPWPSDPEAPLNTVAGVFCEGGALLCQPDAAHIGPLDETALGLDVPTQRFSPPTSVFRLYPAGKSNTTVQDPDLSALNESFGRLVAARPASLRSADQRGSYRLIGGLWLDKPRAFTLDTGLQNDATSPLLGSPEREADILQNGTASPFSVQGGEDRLLGIATESFAQIDRAYLYPNCLHCHNTRASNAHGGTCFQDATAAKLLDAKSIGVSRVFSEFVLRECAEPSPARPAFCGESCP